MKTMQKLIVLTFFLSINIVHAQCYEAYNYDHKKISDLEKRSLTGNITSTKYSHYDIIDKFGILSKGEKNCEQLIIFNPNGSVMKILEYNTKGNIMNMDIHEYENEQIKLISHYNAQGDLIAKTAFIKEGNNIREQRYIADGKLNSQYFVRTYDSQNNLTKEIWKEHDSPKDTNQYLFFYDNNNRVIKMNTENYSTRAIYENEKSKLPTKVEYIDPETNKVERTRSYVYDKYGNRIKEYLNHDLLRNYEFTYDDQGNWTKKIQFNTEAAIPQEITIRKIIYFQ